VYVTETSADQFKGEPSPSGVCVRESEREYERALEREGERGREREREKESDT